MILRDVQYMTVFTPSADKATATFLARERGRVWALDEASMEQAARETLVTLSVSTPVTALCGGSALRRQRRTVTIAKAVLWDSKVVLLDEPPPRSASC